MDLWPDRSRRILLFREMFGRHDDVGIDRHEGRVESLRRGDGDVWTFHDMSDDAVVRIAYLDFGLPIAEVFDGLEPPAEPEPAA